jgi:HK97 family phage prohead protease
MPAPATTAKLDYDFGLRNERVREDGDTLIISGLASNFDLDRESEKMARYAFDRGLKRYLETNPVLLFNHTYSRPLGRVRKAEVTDAGLYIEAELPRPEPNTDDMNVWQLVKRGVLRALSVGGRFDRKVINGIRTITNVDLREISVAAAGVVPQALFSVQAGKAFGDPIDADLSAIRARLGVLRMKRTVDGLNFERDCAAFYAAGSRINALA